MQKEFEFYLNLLNISLEATNTCLIVLDSEIRQYVCIFNSEKIFGLSPDEIMQKIRLYQHMSVHEYLYNVSALFTHPDDWDVKNEAFRQALNGQETSYEARMRSTVTDYSWRKVKLIPYFEKEKPRYVIGLCCDINELKIAQRKLKKISGVDPFTGGFNKPFFFSKVRDYLLQNQKGKHAFILLDIDDFKYVNDSFGHAHGDQVLLNVAKKLIDWAEKKQGFLGGLAEMNF